MDNTPNLYSDVNSYRKKCGLPSNTTVGLLDNELKSLHEDLIIDGSFKVLIGGETKNIEKILDGALSTIYGCLEYIIAMGIDEQSFKRLWGYVHIMYMCNNEDSRPELDTSEDALKKAIGYKELDA